MLYILKNIFLDIFDKGRFKKIKEVIMITLQGGESARFNDHFLFLLVPNVLKIISRHQSFFMWPCGHIKTPFGVVADILRSAANISFFPFLCFEFFQGEKYPFSKNSQKMV